MPRFLLLANVVVPSIQMHLSAMVVVLAPIIFIETILVRQRLGGEWRATGLHVTVANAASTLVGIPVAWLVMLGVTLLAHAGGLRPGTETPLGLLGTAALGVGSSGSGPRGLGIPLALASTIIMLLPSLLASIRVEHRVLLRRMPGVDPERIGAAVRVANVVTYGILAALLRAEVWSTVA